MNQLEDWTVRVHAGHLIKPIGNFGIYGIYHRKIEPIEGSEKLRSFSNFVNLQPNRLMAIREAERMNDDIMVTHGQ